MEQLANSFPVALLRYIDLRLHQKELGAFVILGPDGSGKTTLLPALVENAPGEFIGLDLGRRAKKSILNDGLNAVLLTILDKLQGILKSQRAPLLRALVAPLFHFVTYVELLARLIRTVPLTQQKTVLIERYYGVDCFTDPKRESHSPLERLATRLFFPKPGKVALLGGNAQEIADRKADIQADGIREYLRRTKAYLDRHGISYIFVDTVQNDIPQSVKAISDELERSSAGLG